jgi:hypothetical protein
MQTPVPTPPIDPFASFSSSPSPTHDGPVLVALASTSSPALSASEPVIARSGGVLGLVAVLVFVVVAGGGVLLLLVRRRRIR